MSTQHKGWHSRGYLPHFDSAETTQFITFRLADSLPKSVAETLARKSDDFAEVDERLDAGFGVCWLRQEEIAVAVESAILHFDDVRYRVLAWCIMPNHIHVVIDPSEGHRLGDIVHSWKSFSANKANRLLERKGAFWHRDYFDRFIRNERHLARTVEYVENNPIKAGLAAESKDWPWSSARYRT